MSSRADVIVIVQGEDWEGNAAPRYVGAGHSVCLRGKLGEGFDVRGPHVWACAECGDLLFSETTIYPVEMQRHYSDAHGYTPAVMA